jgi:8-oxo-dGTP diphosphatase
MSAGAAPEQSSSTIVHVGVQCFVLSDSRLLLGHRSSGFGINTWGLPGGHLERGETVLQAAARELQEETGLVASQMRIAAIGDPIVENNFHLQIGVLIEQWAGAPSVTQPDEIDELQFFPTCALPSNLLVSSAYIIEKLFEQRLY